MVFETLIGFRCLSKLDTECLDSLKDYNTVITLEDGITDGGFGQKVAAYLGTSKANVHVLGLKKEFLDRYNPAEVLKTNGLTPEQIADIV